MGRNADAVAEGMQIAGAAARLAVKNIIVMETIGHGADFDRDALAAYAHDVLIGLADEQDEAARLVERQRKQASGRWSDSYGTHDYRDRDVRNLRRRRKQYEGVAKQLRLRAEDEAAVDELVEQARLSAWSDVERNLQGRLAVESMRADADPDYDSLREARMSAVSMIDLQRLAARQRKLGHLPARSDD